MVGFGNKDVGNQLWGSLFVDKYTSRAGEIGLFASGALLK